MAIVATYSFSGISAATFSFAGVSSASFTMGGAAYRLKDADGNEINDAGGNPVWIIEV